MRLPLLATLRAKRWSRVRGRPGSTGVGPGRSPSLGPSTRCVGPRMWSYSTRSAMTARVESVWCIAIQNVHRLHALARWDGTGGGRIVQFRFFVGILARTPCDLFRKKGTCRQLRAKIPDTQPLAPVQNRKSYSVTTRIRIVA